MGNNPANNPWQLIEKVIDQLEHSYVTLNISMNPMCTTFRLLFNSLGNTENDCKIYRAQNRLDQSVSQLCILACHQ